MLSAVHSDRSGRLMVASDYSPAMFDGTAVRPFAGGVALAQGAELVTLDREAIGLDRNGRPRPLGPGRFAVAAIAPLGQLRTALPAYGEPEDAPALARRAYAAVAGDANGDLVIAAAPIDPDTATSDRRNDAAVPSRISTMLGELPGNRLARQLARCARDYRCRAAANAFAGVADCAVPVAAPTNERPPEPVSIRGDVDASPTEAAAFHPTADEIAAVALRHLGNGGTMVSFGRACEGEPLLAARLLEAAVGAIRARTAGGTLHLETNGSNPAALRRLIMAGLDSVAVRLASARAETYELLHGPQGYRFGDVRASIDVAAQAGATVSLVVLVMPGLTDRSRELDAIVGLAADLPPRSQLLLRDLACDPRRTIGLLPTDERAAGIAAALDRIRADAPKVRIGALVRPLARV
jgi:pyruvate-formate lyase-activating enzyme